MNPTRSTLAATALLLAALPAPTAAATAPGDSGGAGRAHLLHGSADGLNGDGTADPAFGAEGENSGDGTVMTLTGGLGASYGPTALAAGTGRGVGAALTR